MHCTLLSNWITAKSILLWRYFDLLCLWNCIKKLLYKAFNQKSNSFYSKCLLNAPEITTVHIVIT